MLIEDCIFRVIDTETTGLTENDRVVEVAYQDSLPLGEGLDFYIHDNRHEWLVNPGISIPPEASAIHHLTDADVENRCTIEEIRDMLNLPHRFRTMPDSAPVIHAAHNAEFDRGMLGDNINQPAQWLCTRRFAAHLLPEMDRHNNQYLRYALKLRVGLPPDTAAHRAMADVIVTTAVLEYLLETMRTRWPEVTTIEELIERTNGPIRLRKIRFGKHADMEYNKVETSYLQWMLRTGAGSEDDRHTARCVLNDRARGVLA